MAELPLLWQRRALTTCSEVGTRESPGGLHALLQARRDALLSCWTRKAKTMVAPGPLPPAELLDQMPAFVDQIIQALSAKPGPAAAARGQAEEHGAQRLRLGFDVAEVIREYGLL